MPAVNLDTMVPSPQSIIGPRLHTILATYAQREDFSLSVEAGLAGTTVSVAVTINLVQPDRRTAFTIPVAIAAAHHVAWFPQFSGEVRSVARTPLDSALQLVGEYAVPLGTLGAVADRVALTRVAESSLRIFLMRVREDVLDEVQRSELSIRQRDA